jgi:hypothetical protein
MSRPVDSGRVDLQQVFLHLQSRMLAHLEVGSALEHASTCGAASEAHWLNLFNAHLPERYRASSAFVVDSDGRRSRQIDIAIYDRFYSPLIFPYESGFLVPAESVYAIVEVKQVLTRQYMRDAGVKIASVRRLRRTSVPVPFAGGAYPPKAPHPILGIVVATRSVWPKTFEPNLGSALEQLDARSSVDLGCVVTQGAFERRKPARASAVSASKSPGRKRSTSTPAPRLTLSDPAESLIWFMLRLIERLRALGNAPAADLMSYGRTLKSLC